MPLTAEDVKNKQFTPTRFKGGYDEKEVDDFLDEVEAELSRLTRENTDLRTRLQVAEQAARQPAPAPALHRRRAAARAGRLRRPPPAAGAAAATAAGDGSAAAAAAGRAAAARGRPAAAPGIRAAVRRPRCACWRWRNRPPTTRCPTREREADKVLGEARLKADQLERETQERHRSVVGNLDSERERLERKIEELRSFEREYRARLKSYLEGQLRDLDGRTEGVQPTAPRPVRPPAACRSLALRPQRPCQRRSVHRARRRVASPSLTPPSLTPPSAAVSAGLGARRQPTPRRYQECSSRPGHRARSRPMPPPPVPGRRLRRARRPTVGPGAPPRQPAGGGFEVDDGPEVPPSHG